MKAQLSILTLLLAIITFAPAGSAEPQYDECVDIFAPPAPACASGRIGGVTDAHGCITHWTGPVKTVCHYISEDQVTLCVRSAYNPEERTCAFAGTQLENSEPEDRHVYGCATFQVLDVNGACVRVYPETLRVQVCLYFDEGPICQG